MWTTEDLAEQDDELAAIAARVAYLHSDEYLHTTGDEYPHGVPCWLESEEL